MRRIKYNPTIEVDTAWVEDIIHAVGTLAQYFLSHCKDADVNVEERLIEEGCDYLRKAERTGGEG